YMNSVPVIAICGETATDGWGRGGWQESSGWGPRTVSQQKAFEGCVKWRVTVDKASEIETAMKSAFRAMLTGRKGPVQIQIPVDAQREVVEAALPEPARNRARSGGGGEPGLVKRAAALLASAESPAILAGWGVIESGASRELRELAELLAAPVATTFRGKGAFPEDHDLALGVSGSMGHDTAGRYLTKENVDVLLGVGATFSQMTTIGWKQDYGGRKIIQIDVDPLEIGKIYPVEVGIVGDAKTVLLGLVEEVRALLKGNGGARKARLEAVKRFKEELKYYSEPEIFSGSVPVKPQRALKELRDALPKDAVVFTDCGNNCMWTERFFKAYLPGTLIFDGITHMGWTAAGVIGAKMAVPDKVVATILGDGSFSMNCQDVKTADTYGVPVIWFVLNDGALGAIRHRQTVMPGRRLEEYVRLDTDNMDFVKFAEACGVRGERCEKPGEIGPAVKRAIESQEPTVLDVIVDRDEPHPGISALAKMVKH
ncbi:MAG: thiamine pyrophosphate-binding protein, partial [Candidatus Brockarchaeota archaeon]|nr:thiamine pyrophosphate-binding protein [Candidatus Brockarchaeota archaeon]